MSRERVRNFTRPLLDEAKAELGGPR